jgi:hypothetical protein
MEGGEEMKVTAWIGTGFMLISAVSYVFVTWFIDHTLDPVHPTMDLSFIVPMPFALIAVPLMLIGGFFGKPKYFWLVSLISGLFCLLVFYPIMEGSVQNYQHTAAAYRNITSSAIRNVLISILPGMLLLIEAIILFVKRKSL